MDVKHELKWVDTMINKLNTIGEPLKIWFVRLFHNCQKVILQILPKMSDGDNNLINNGNKRNNKFCIHKLETI